MQKKLLVEVSLTFSRAVEIAQSMESAAVRTKQLQSHMNTGGQHQRDVNHLASTSNTCYRCGRVDHQSAHCPFKTAQCHNCGKQGRIQAACRQPKKQTFPTNKRGRRRGNYFQTRGRGRSQGQGRSIRTVQEEPDNLEFDLNNIRRLYQVNTNTDKPYTVDLKLNGKVLTMEIDTGACVSLISEQTFKQLFPKKSLKPSKARLSTYSGQAITSKGEIDVIVTYGDQQATLPLIVVASTGPSLFGINWLTTILLDWKSIRSVSHQPPITELLQKYSEVFKGGLGKIIGHKAKIHVDPYAQPRYCTARPLPYALRSKVEAELECLQRLY